MIKSESDMQDIPALLREMSACYHQAIAILNSQGITKDDPDWGKHLANQIRALALEEKAQGERENNP